MHETAIKIYIQFVHLIKFKCLAVVLVIIITLFYIRVRIGTSILIMHF